jgi:hypothetical protein
MDKVARGIVFRLKHLINKQLSQIVVDYLCWPVHACFETVDHFLVTIISRKWNERKTKIVYKCKLFYYDMWTLD